MVGVNRKSLIKNRQRGFFLLEALWGALLIWFILIVALGCVTHVVAMQQALQERLLAWQESRFLRQAVEAKLHLYEEPGAILRNGEALSFPNHQQYTLYRQGQFYRRMSDGVLQPITGDMINHGVSYTHFSKLVLSDGEQVPIFTSTDWQTLRMRWQVKSHGAAYNTDITLLPYAVFYHYPS